MFGQDIVSDARLKNTILNRLSNFGDLGDEIFTQSSSCSSILEILIAHYGESFISTNFTPNNMLLVNSIKDRYNYKISYDLRPLSDISFINYFLRYIIDSRNIKCKEDLFKENNICIAISRFRRFILEDLLNNSFDITNYEFIIHKPSFTIKNSNRNEHVINDFFIKIVVNFNGSILTTHITRTTFSKDEFRCHYIHSHAFNADHFEYLFANSSSLDNRRNYWCKFCTGSGPIGNTINKLKNKYEANIFNLLLFEFDNYVKWESIEGGPTIRMTKINDNAISLVSSGSSDIYILTPEQLELIDLLLLEIIDSRLISFSLNKIENRVYYDIENLNEELLGIITKLVLSKYDNNVESIQKLINDNILFIYANGISNILYGIRYKKLSNTSSLSFDTLEAMNKRNIPMIKFKGIDIPLKITDITPDKINYKNYVWSLNPMMIRVLLNKLLYYANYQS